MLQLGVGAGRLQLTSPLGQLLLHVARHLMNARAESQRQVQVALTLILAQNIKGFGRSAGSEQKLGLKQAFGRIDSAVRSQLPQTLQVAARARQIAQPRARHAPGRQDVERQEGLAVDQRFVRGQAVQHAARIPPRIGEEGAQGGVIGAEAFQVRALAEPMMGRIVKFRVRQVPHLKRHPRQIIEAVEVGTRIIGIGIVDLETAEGRRRSSHVAQLHQAHAGHFPDPRARGGGIGVMHRDLAFGRGQQAQAFADAVLIHQGQGAQAGRMSHDEPVAARPRRVRHLLLDRQIALVVADGQGVQPRNGQVALVVLGPRLGLQAIVPEGRLFEVPLVQDRPCDVIEPVQPLAVAPLHGLQAKGLQRREIRAGGPLLHGAGQLRSLSDAGHGGRGRRQYGDSDQGRTEKGHETYGGHPPDSRPAEVA
ncbi:hypothetical protein D3C73_807890 [compost metagenome]